MRRTRSGSVALVLAGVGLGVGLSGGMLTRNALAQHREHEHEREHNPRIHAAVAALRDAQSELDVAGEDYHGHKRDAQGAVQHAIDELDRIKDW